MTSRAPFAASGRVGCVGVGLLCLLLLAAPLSAQDLDPRAYVHVPVNGTFLIAGFSVSDGAIVTDPALALTDINATVEAPSVGIARSFSFFGKTGQVFAALPYAWAQVSGKVFEESASTSRAGLGDMRIRISALLHGAPAASMPEIAKAPRRTILGTSLTIGIPTGQFFPSRLINVGTNRWLFKPAHSRRTSATRSGGRCGQPSMQRITLEVARPLTASSMTTGSPTRAWGRPSPLRSADGTRSNWR